MIILFFLLQLENLELDIPIEESSYQSELEYLLDHPLNPNRARIEDWLRIPFLTPVDAYRLVENRGSYKSSEDIIRSGISRDKLTLLKPFIRIGKIRRSKKLRLRWRYQIFNLDSLEDARLYTKTTARLGSYEFFFTTEKDPYEDSYFDYLGYGLVIKGTGINLGLGRYDLELGEGVILGPEPFLFLKDYNFQSPRRGIIPYTKVAENDGFYGIALSYNGLYAFLSRFRLDAVVSDDTIRGIDYTGSHKDSATIADKDRLREDILGIAYQFSIDDNIVGLKGYHLNYRPGIFPDDSLPFTGEKINLFGLDFRRYGRNGEVFFEAGLADRTPGLISGFVFRFGDLGASGNWGYYPPNFYSPHGGIVETGKQVISTNLTFLKREYELGLRSYYQIRLANDDAYYDLRPYLKNRFGPFTTDLELRFRTGDVPTYHRGSSFRIIYKGDIIKIFVRMVERTYPDEPSSFYTGLGFSTIINFLRLTGGIGRYLCPGGPIYIYQPDLPGRFNTVVLTDKGVEYYLILSLNFLKRSRVYLKVSDRVLSLQTDLTF